MSDHKTLQLLRMAAAFSFLLALVNHILPPKAFSATQLLFDYEFGITRRGLVGEVLNLFTGKQISLPEIYLATGVLSLGAAIGFYLFLQKHFEGSVASYLLMILALNSFAFASFIGNTGYLDGVILMLALSALLSDATRKFGLFLRLGVCAIGVLAHENMLPFFSVLIGLDIWLARGPGIRSFLLALAPALSAMVVVLLLSALAQKTPETADAFVDYMSQKAEFSVDATATDVAGRSLGDNFEMMREMRQTRKYWAWILFDGVPLLGMSLWLIWLNLKLVGPSRGVLTKLIIVGAIAAPLSLNIIAFDVVRFGAASVLVGFVVAGLVLRYDQNAKITLNSTLSWPHFLVVLVLNANISTIQVNEGAGHMAQFPWVLMNQLQWLTP